MFSECSAAQRQMWLQHKSTLPQICNFYESYQDPSIPALQKPIKLFFVKNQHQNLMADYV